MINNKKSRHIKFLSLLISISLIFTLLVPISASAISVEQTEIWQTEFGFDYPISISDDTWVNLSYHEQLEICNMPQDLLQKCSTNELADLVLEYPFLIDVLAFNSCDLAISHLADISNICEEFFTRDDAISILLDKYAELEVDYTELVNTSRVSVGRESGYVAELFLQTYFAAVYDSLSDIQVSKLTDILESKYLEKEGLCDDYSTALLIFDWIQKDNGSIPENLLTQNIISALNVSGDVQEVNFESLTRASSGFTSSGRYVSNGSGVVYEVGEYSRYGTTVDCLRYYSGDLTSNEKTLVNNSFDEAHPSWTRVSSCTYKYNCHSYAWISSSSSNTYWVNNPDNFAGSDSFDFVGHGFNTSVASGDKIIICSAISTEDGFGGYTYSVHSANVTSSSGTTKSKLGAYGVYIIPVDELMTFYSGFYYNIYR